MIANLWLAGSGDAVGREFHEHHPAFGFYLDLDFEENGSFLDWLNAQRERGTDRAWLHRPPIGASGSELEHRVAGFVGGVQTGLLVTGNAASELRVSHMEQVEPPTKPAVPGRRSRLAFTRHPMPDAAPLTVPVSEATEYLTAALSGALYTAVNAAYLAAANEDER